MWQGEMLGHGHQALLLRSSPPPACFWQGALQSIIKKLWHAHMLYMGVPLAVRPSRLRASPSPPAFPGSCLVLASSSKPEQAAASRIPQLWPMAPSRTSIITPVHRGTGTNSGFQEELSPPSASQTVTEAPDQRPTSVEYPFCLHSVSHALIIVLIKTVLILTSPVVSPLSYLIVFLTSLPAPHTQNPILATLSTIF